MRVAAEPACGNLLHESLAIYYNNLGLALTKAERYEEAQEQYESVLAINERLHGSQDRYTASTLCVCPDMLAFTRLFLSCAGTW